MFLEASARNMSSFAEQAELKASMEMLKTKFSCLPNMIKFSCEAYPTFSRCQCKAWYGAYFNEIK